MYIQNLPTLTSYLLQGKYLNDGVKNGGIPNMLKTLFNIVEAPYKQNRWTLMSVLYDDVQMDQ